MGATPSCRRSDPRRLLLLTPDQIQSLQVDNARMKEALDAPLTAKALAEVILGAMTEEPSELDYGIAKGALKLLPDSSHPDRIVILAEVARDYRLARQALSPTSREGEKT